MDRKSTHNAPVWLAVLVQEGSETLVRFNKRRPAAEWLRAELKRRTGAERLDGDLRVVDQSRAGDCVGYLVRVSDPYSIALWRADESLETR